MDIAQYAEMVVGDRLPDWQKEHLRRVWSVARDNKIHIIMGKGGRVYTYLTPKTVRELTQNAQTPNYRN